MDVGCQRTHSPIMHIVVCEHVCRCMQGSESTASFLDFLVPDATFFNFPQLLAASACALFCVSFTLRLMRKSGRNTIPDLIAFSACMVEEVGATALLYVLGAGPFNLVGPLTFVFDYLPVALGSCPLDPGWGGEGLLSGGRSYLDGRFGVLCCRKFCCEICR